MELKRIYKRVLDEDGIPVVISTGKLKGQILLEQDDKGHPVVDHVAVKRVGDVGTKQNFSSHLMLDWLQTGFCSFADDVVTVNTAPKLEFKIIRKPGYYCCHDHHPCRNGNEAREHIAENFAGEESPDLNNPSGYRKDNFYATERVA